ncbi:hypothetical protein C1H46_003838 [Malus baccata]|uniref:Uncharacterized protein n=1 Tax=Malus baccata TaxID=106549 RepID=A0A540NJD6_MALBA|nr:hypothetical protein C1H46_003838 [Malus baccata]
MPRHLHMEYYHQREEESMGQIDSDNEEENETIQDLRQATRKGKKERLTKENCKRRLIRKGKNWRCCKTLW